jgi:hypothetical protein
MARAVAGRHIPTSAATWCGCGAASSRRKTTACRGILAIRASAIDAGAWRWRQRQVRLAPESGHRQRRWQCQLFANKRHTKLAFKERGRQLRRPYSSISRSFCSSRSMSARIFAVAASSHAISRNWRRHSRICIASSTRSFGWGIMPNSALSRYVAS